MSALCHNEMLLTETEQSVPEPEVELAQKEKMSQEKLKEKTYGPGINSASNKC